MNHVEPWPVVGRHEELAFVADVIHDQTQRGALVAGEAGVGKTRLVREALSLVPGCHVETVTATESARALPFGAFAHLLPFDMAQVDRVDLLTFVGRHLLARAGEQPFVLAVDDVHLLDGHSAALVHYLGQHTAATLLLTMRSGEVAPDAIVGLYRDALIKRLELQPISREEFGQLLETVLGGQVEGVTADRFWRMTQGNVLFAHELIADAMAGNTLALDHRVWRWSGKVDKVPRLRETIAGRLEGLDPADRRILELVAIAEPLDVAAVEQIAPDGSLLGLEHRGLTTLDTGIRPNLVRLCHPLIGEVLREGMPGSARQELMSSLARHFEGRPGLDAGDLLRVAVWKETVGDPVDATTLVGAARLANQLTDHPLAERFARAALPQTGFAALLELGWALIGQARYQEAENALMAIEVTPAIEDSDLERLADAIGQAVGHGLGRIDDAGKVLESIERGVKDPEMSALVRCHRANLLAFHCRYVEAAELGSEALQHTANDSVRVRALTSVGASLVMAGRTNEALELTSRELSTAFRLSDRFPRAPGWVLGTHLSALAFNGRASEAIHEIEGFMASVPGRSAELLAQANTLLGRLHLLQGRVATARRYLFDAAVTTRGDPAVREPSWCIALAGEAEALLGHTDGANRLSEEAHALRRPEILAYEVDTRRSLAWIDVQAGRISSAIEQLWEANRLAEERGQRWFRLLILNDLLRLGEAQAVPFIKQTAPLVDGAVAVAIADHATAVSSDAAADFERAAQAFEEIGMALVAAELWASASIRYQHTGLRARATTARKASARLSITCEGARTQSLAWVVTSPSAITRRQREIALRAAQGDTNAQIAADLCVSERTVESHLYSVFAKLGISDRSQLADELEAGAR
jgi:DNA-binding CsgD family transcriptional regulator